MEVSRTLHRPNSIKTLFIFCIIIGIVWANLAWSQKTEQDVMQLVQRVRTDLKNQLYQRINGNQEIAPLIGKMPLQIGEDISFDMLAHTGTPSDIERRGVLAYARAYEIYVKDMSDLYTLASGPPGSVGASAFFSGLVRIFRSGASSTLNELAELYNGKISFGEYSKRRNEIVVSSSNSTSRLIESIKSANDRQWNEQQQARERADQRRRDQMQSEYEKNRLNITTCNRVGDSLFRHSF